MAPFIEESECSFCFSWSTVKKEQKKQNPLLSRLSGGARHPCREREQCGVEEAQLQIGRLFLFFRQAQQKKARGKNGEEKRNSRFTSFLCRTYARELMARRCVTASGPGLTSRFQEDTWPAGCPHLPPLLLHTLAEPVAVMVSHS